MKKVNKVISFLKSQRTRAISSKCKKIILKVLRRYIIKSKYMGTLTEKPFNFRNKVTFCFRLFDDYYFVSNSILNHYLVEHKRLKSLLIPSKKIEFYDYLVKDKSKLMCDFYKRPDKKWQFTTNILMLIDKDNWVETDEEIVNNHLKHTIPIADYSIENGFLNFNYAQELVHDLRKEGFLNHNLA